MTNPITSDFRFEEFAKHMWRWITKGGTVDPVTDPPDVNVSGVAEINLDPDDDGVKIYGEQDGAGTTRVVNVDSSGRVRTAVQDGQDAALGATTDPAIDSDTTGTVSGKLRGLVKILANVWNSSLGTLKVSQATHDNLNLNANLQVGDTDIPGGAGVATASTPRVSIATDDTVNASLAAIESDTDASRIALQLIDDTVYTDGTGTPSKAIGIAGTDGTNPQIVKTDANGELQVDVLSSALPSGAATEATLSAFKTENDSNLDAANASLDAIEASASVMDDWDEVDRAKVNPIVGQAGVQGAAGVSTSNTQRVAIATDANVVAQPTHDNFNANANLQVANTDVATTNPVPVQGNQADGAAPVGNPILLAGSDGTLAQTLRTDTTGDVGVYDKSANVAIGDAAANSTPVPLNEAGTSLITQVVRPYWFNGTNWDRARGNTTGQSNVGGLAHDIADVANNHPFKAGHQAIAHGSNPAAVAAGDVTNSYANRHGIPFHIGGHPNVISVQYHATTAHTDDDIVLVGAGAKIVVTRIAVSLDEACTVGVDCRIGFGTASVPATPADGATVNGVLMDHPGLVPGGGTREGDGSGILGVGGDGEDLRITHSVPTGGNLNVVVSYFTIES